MLPNLRNMWSIQAAITLDVSFRMHMQAVCSNMGYQYISEMVSRMLQWESYSDLQQWYCFVCRLCCNWSRQDYWCCRMCHLRRTFTSEELVLRALFRIKIVFLSLTAIPPHLTWFRTIVEGLISIIGAYGGMTSELLMDQWRWLLNWKCRSRFRGYEYGASSSIPSKYSLLSNTEEGMKKVHEIVLTACCRPYIPNYKELTVQCWAIMWSSHQWSFHTRDGFCASCSTLPTSCFLHVQVLIPTTNLILE